MFVKDSKESRLLKNVLNSRVLRSLYNYFISKANDINKRKKENLYDTNWWYFQVWGIKKDILIKLKLEIGICTK